MTAQRADSTRMVAVCAAFLGDECAVQPRLLSVEDTCKVTTKTLERLEEKMDRLLFWFVAIMGSVLLTIIAAAVAVVIEVAKSVT